MEQIMKKVLLALLILTFASRVYCQDGLTINQTIDYINTKLKSNPFIDSEKIPKYFSISLSTDGMLKVDIFLNEIHLGLMEIYIKNIDFEKTFELCPLNQDEIYIFCETKGTNSKCVKKSINWWASHVVTYENSINIMFSNGYKIEEGLCNAFRHLFQSVMADPHYFTSDSNDPFSNNDIKTVKSMSPETKSCKIRMTKDHNTYALPIEINNVLKIQFIMDTGASEVSISPDVAIVLIKTGTIEDLDWLPSQTYRFADGSTAKSSRFKIKSLKIGEFTLKNVTASISNSISAPMLLGQNVLNKFGNVSIDNKNHILTITK